jgi:hypothetical protein
MNTGTLFGRTASLIVAGGANGLDLSPLHFTFSIRAAEIETPNSATFRVFNLAPDTERRIINEFDSISLSAGYQEQNGVVFSGTITSVTHGKQTNVDTFLQIDAGDGDLGYNFGVANQTLAAGSSLLDAVRHNAAAMNVQVDPNLATLNPSLGGIVLPRGKVQFGLARVFMRNIADTVGARWSIQHGVLTLVPLTGYLPGEAVVLNSSTGMVGIPEATDNGINVRCLLNSRIRVGGTIKLDNRDILQTVVKTRAYPNTNPLYYSASTATDGIYRVIVNEFEGDSRGLDWYSDLVCLAVDPTSPPNDSVKAYP